MTTATLKYSRLLSNVQGKFGSVALPKVNWRVICFTCFLASSLLLSFYVYQVINLTITSYSINSYENKIAEISQENNNLEVSFEENNFLAAVMERATQMGFHRTASITYLQILNNSVAKAR